MAESSLYGMPARYLATPPTLSDGDAVPLLVDINGALIVSGGGISPVQEQYTVTNYDVSRTLDAGNATTADVADVLATLIVDLQAAGIIQ